MGEALQPASRPGLAPSLPGHTPHQVTLATAAKVTSVLGPRLFLPVGVSSCAEATASAAEAAAWQIGSRATVTLTPRQAEKTDLCVTISLSQKFIDIQKVAANYQVVQLLSVSRERVSVFYFENESEMRVPRRAPAGDAHHLAAVPVRAATFCIIQQIKSGAESRDAVCRLCRSGAGLAALDLRAAAVGGAGGGGCGRR